MAIGDARAERLHEGSRFKLIAHETKARNRNALSGFSGFEHHDSLSEGNAFSRIDRVVADCCKPRSPLLLFGVVEQRELFQITGMIQRTRCCNERW